MHNIPKFAIFNFITNLNNRNMNCMKNGLIKTVLTVTAYFIIALSIILAFTIYDVNEWKKMEIRTYYQQQRNHLEQSLKDYVDVAYAIIDNDYKNSQSSNYLEKQYGQRLVNIVEIVEAILQAKAMAVQENFITLAVAQEQAIAEINQLRYDHGEGSIWITDMETPFPKIIRHPFNSNLVGKSANESQINTVNGKNLFVTAVEACNAHGKGFINYLWPKNSNSKNNKVLKLAYVKSFAEWNWVIGTSIYVDNASLEAVDKAKEYIRHIRYHNGTGYLWIVNTFPETSVVMEPMMPALEESLLKDKKKELFSSFKQICDRSSKSGYIEQNWPKLLDDSTSKDVKKLFYVKKHEALNWIIGTGIYLDELETMVANKQLEAEKHLDYFMKKMGIISIIAVLLISLLTLLLRKIFVKSKAGENQQPNRKRSKKSKHYSASMATDSIIKPQTSMNNAAPQNMNMPYATNVTQNTAMLPTSECVKMVEEISKILIAEQSKLIAAMHQNQATQTPTAYQQNQMQMPNKVNEAALQAETKQVTDKVKQLANQTSKTIDDVKRMIAGKQVANQQPDNIFQQPNMTIPQQPSAATPQIQPFITTHQTIIPSLAIPSEPTQVQTNGVDMNRFNNVMKNLNKMVGNVNTSEQLKTFDDDANNSGQLQT